MNVKIVKYWESYHGLYIKLFVNDVEVAEWSNLAYESSDASAVEHALGLLEEHGVLKFTVEEHESYQNN